MIEYILISIFAIFLGQIVAHLNKKLPPVVAEEITYKEYYAALFKDFKIDIKYSFILLIIFNMLIYFTGNNVTTYIYATLISTLMIVFSVDYRFQLIPDECDVIIIFLAIINIFFNLSNWTSYILGAIVGGGIFYLISLLAVIIFKKEGMGFGDVKLMASLGLLFGFKTILVITLVSFFVGAVIGGTLMIIKRKEASSYMPFGPFIVAATILIIFINPDDIINIYITFCTWLSLGITDAIYFFSK